MENKTDFTNEIFNCEKNTLLAVVVTGLVAPGLFTTEADRVSPKDSGPLRKFISHRLVGAGQCLQEIDTSSPEDPRDARDGPIFPYSERYKPN